MKGALSIGALFFLGICLAGCEREPEIAPQEVVRTVKTVTISEAGGGQLRRFAGTAQAVTHSQLSFPVAGKVMEIHVDQGDRVEQGQLLALLDQEAFLLRLDHAEADLGKAHIERRNSLDELTRMRKLAKRGSVSQSNLDKAEARFDAANRAVDVAKAQVALGQRDINSTELRAPFDGTVVERRVNPFMEIQPGQILFEVEGDNELEVELLIPETLIGWIELGQKVDVEFPIPGLRGQKSTGTVSGIGVRADDANAYPIKIILLDPSSKIRSGMTAEVSFIFQTSTKVVVYLVPINAILPPIQGPQKITTEQRDASLFVFDQATSTVNRRPVIVAYFSGDQAGVESGIEKGDIVVVAGVHHLHDGQEVRLLE